jgi:hypothetical protein
MHTNHADHSFDIWDSCPPETPHQLYTNVALEAISEKYAALISDLSEEVAEVVFAVAVLAADTALQAANVSNNWRDVIATQRKWGGE